MKKAKAKGWVQDEPEYDPEEEQIDLDLPGLPQLKNKKKQLKKLKDGNPEGTNLQRKVDSKRRLNIR